VRAADTPARWSLCFLVLPALWIAGSLATDLQAVLMIPAAVVVALLSALIAYRSGRGKRSALGHFLGTGVMMGVAFAVTVVIVFTIYCGDGSTEGVC
jgi:predicted membrane protein